jgi:hypothetical protein
MIIVFLRPIFSAKGKAKSAPKKQPAYSTSDFELIIAFHVADLESGDDVALSRIALSLGHTTHVEVTLKRSERHGTTNHCGIITHYQSVNLCLS